MIARGAALVALALVACASAPLQVAQRQGAPWTVVYPPREDVTVTLSDDAAGAVKAIAFVSYAMHRELAACVIRFRMATALKDVRAVAPGDTVTIHVEELAPAHPYDSDSLYIRADRALCDSGVPVLHTHVTPNEALLQPSDVDLATARSRTAPFDLLVSAVGPRAYVLTVYALRRTP